MTSPDPKTQAQAQAQTRHAYDVVADDYAALIPGVTAESALDVAMINDFAQRCRRAQLGPVADVGCGPGRISAHLAGQGVDVFGIDLSEAMVDVARRDHPLLRFDVGAMEDLPVDDRSLGGLLAWYSLIHIPPGLLTQVIGEFARTLLPGAWLLTAFQAGDGQRVERAEAYGHPVRLINFRHRPKHVAALLDAGGFDVHAQLRRSAEAAETTPQAILLARRRH